MIRLIVTGFVSVEWLFRPSVDTPCPVQQGQRYNDETLEIKYRREIEDQSHSSVPV